MEQQENVSNKLCEGNKNVKMPCMQQMPQTFLFLKTKAMQVPHVLSTKAK